MGIPRSILQSAAIIRRFSPSVVLGVGGYSSGPFCLAAKGMGIPTAIHEQNSYPGLTNRLLARMVDRTFISFSACKPFLKSKRTVLTGNPVRKELLRLLKKGLRTEKHSTCWLWAAARGPGR